MLLLLIVQLVLQFVIPVTNILKANYYVSIASSELSKNFTLILDTSNQHTYITSSNCIGQGGLPCHTTNTYTCPSCSFDIMTSLMFMIPSFNLIGGTLSAGNFALDSKQISNLPFVKGTYEGSGTLYTDGMLGLGKKSCDSGIISSLYTQNIITSKVVGLTFSTVENDSKSILAFGESPYTVKTWLPGTDPNLWDIQLDTFKFSFKTITTTAVGVIGSSMELAFCPLDDFNSIIEVMTAAGYQCQWYSGYLYGCLIYNSPLSSLPTMEFTIKNSDYKIVVKPENYAWKYNDLMIFKLNPQTLPSPYPPKLWILSSSMLADTYVALSCDNSSVGFVNISTSLSPGMIALIVILVCVGVAIPSTLIPLKLKGKLRCYKSKVGRGENLKSDNSFTNLAVAIQ